MPTYITILVDYFCIRVNVYLQCDNILLYVYCNYPIISINAILNLIVCIYTATIFITACTKIKYILNSHTFEGWVLFTMHPQQLWRCLGYNWQQQYQMHYKRTSRCCQVERCLRQVENFVSLRCVCLLDANLTNQVNVLALV